MKYVVRVIGLVVFTWCTVGSLVHTSAAPPNEPSPSPARSNKKEKEAKESRTTLSDLFHLLRQDMMPSATSVGKNHELVKVSFQPIANEAAESIARVYVEEEQVALATIVSPAGWLLTKASELTGPAVCQVSGGEKFPARVMATDPEHDVALLKIEVEYLVAAKLADTDNLPVGSWLVTPALGSTDPLVMGIVSVAARAIPRHDAILGIQLAEANEGVKVRAVIPHSAADDAGILPNDVVVSIDRKQVRSSEALIRIIRDMHAGDVIQVEIRRGMDMISVRPRLGRMSDLTQEHLVYKEVVGNLSTRRSDFPRVIQHDTILQPHECGGPVMDTSGRVVGINIARADRTASYAIPARTIRQLLTKHLPKNGSAQP